MTDENIKNVLLTNNEKSNINDVTSEEDDDTENDFVEDTDWILLDNEEDFLM